jgi:hypothetical protein
MGLVAKVSSEFPDDDVCDTAPRADGRELWLPNGRRTTPIVTELSSRFADTIPSKMGDNTSCRFLM